MKNWLENEYVILTGASGGIGRELCKILIKKYRAKVIGVGRNEEKMQSLARELGENADRFSYRLFDVSVKENWLCFRDYLQKQAISPILLINNAGAFPYFRTALNTPSETAEKILKNNVFSILYATESIAPVLCRNGKSIPAIVNIASSAALCPVVGTAVYSASKAAVKNYTEAMQLEEKGKIYIGAIYPGTTATELFDGDENAKNSALRKIAMPAYKMASKIAKRIVKRKKRSALGWDSKAMSFLARFAPVKGVALVAWIMKKTKSNVFSEVFGYEKNNKKW